LAYEVLAGKHQRQNHLGHFLQSIEEQYGQAQRIWVMIEAFLPEAILQAMRRVLVPISYLVGLLPKGN